jgi:signal transduction histidine kinase
MKKQQRNFLKNTKNILLVLLVIVVVFQIRNYYTKLNDEAELYDYNLFMEDLKVDDLEYAKSKQKFYPEDYFTVLNKDLVIINNDNPIFDRKLELTNSELVNLPCGDINHEYQMYEHQEQFLVVAYQKIYEKNYSLYALVIVLIILYIFFKYHEWKNNKLTKDFENEININVKENDHMGDFFNEIIGQLNDLHVSFDEMTNKINTKNNQMNEINVEKKTLIRSINHEVKNPLTAIINCSDSQENDEVIDEKCMQEIKRNAYKINDIMNQLELIIDTDKKLTMIKRDYCDVYEELRKIIVGYVYQFEELNIDYKVDIPDEILTLKINKIGFQCVIDNVINNAIKYNCKSFKLSIIAFNDNNKLNIVITDNGVGIPLEKAELIFDANYQIDNSREGMGLGLFITKKILEIHNGSIKLDSNYLNGCRFIIEMKI